ncbi:MAG: hypothetical protein FJY67_05145 [Calditrichaeota bacterium]|nr:hypothetical protein [Calditrichota bacterium]
MTGRSLILPFVGAVMLISGIMPFGKQPSLLNGFRAQGVLVRLAGVCFPLPSLVDLPAGLMIGLYILAFPLVLVAALVQ